MKLNLTEGIRLRQSPYLAFPGLESSATLPRMIENPGWRSPAAIGTGSTAASPPHFPLLLQLRDHLRVGRVAVYCDDPRPRMTGSLQGFLEELLGRSCVTLSGKPKVDCSARGIDGTIQVPPIPTLANVGFVDPPGAVGRLSSRRHLLFSSGA
jgi:hypothetical protein